MSIDDKENTKHLLDRMLTYLGMTMVSHGHQYYLMSKDNSYLTYDVTCDGLHLEQFCLVSDYAHAIDMMLNTKLFFHAFARQALPYIVNPFYQKTLEEICIMLDLENI